MKKALLNTKTGGLLAVSLLAATLAGCIQPSQSPKQVADKYWQLMQEGNIIEAEKLVSRGSFEHFSHHVKRIDDVSQLSNSNSVTYVTTTITTVDPNSNYAYTQQFNTVMVQEDGKWKIDAAQTSFPEQMSNSRQEMEQLSEEINESVQRNMESIDEAMAESMEMLNEVMEEGSREMGQSLIDMMNKLNESMQESIERLKQEREQQRQYEEYHPDKPAPDEKKGEGVI